MTDDQRQRRDWALILGASSGFGEACALKLAEVGFNIFGVHLDRKATLPKVQEIISRIEGMGRRALFFNINAADHEKRREAIGRIEERLKEGGKLEVMIHSLAFGSLKPFIAKEGQAINPQEMAVTMEVMAHSLLWWVQELIARNLMGRGGRIFAITSLGGVRVWPNYGAVSSAKAALESHVRQLALELAPLGITVNAIRPGATDTPALRKIPGAEKIMETALGRNPGGRLTTPADVANAIAALCQGDISWMTGNVIGVDGGEAIVG